MYMKMSLLVIPVLVVLIRILVVLGTCIDEIQAFRFMVVPDHCPMISKYGPSLSKAVGPSFLVVKKSHFNKNIHLNSTKQKVHVSSQYSKTCLKQPH